MTARQYARLSAPFRQPARRKALLAANKAATWGCYLAYPLLLLVLALQRDGRFFRSLLVPAVSFAALSLVRRTLNFRRPYEVLDIDPIIHKDTKGKSMPSRHVFSIFVIAMTFLWIVPCSARRWPACASSAASTFQGTSSSVRPSGSWPVSLDFMCFETKTTVCLPQTVVFAFYTEKQALCLSF